MELQLPYGITEARGICADGNERWTAFLHYPYQHEGKTHVCCEEIDFDVPLSTPASRVAEAAKLRAEDGYEPGWSKITVEQRFGLYL